MTLLIGLMTAAIFALLATPAPAFAAAHPADVPELSAVIAWSGDCARDYVEPLSCEFMAAARVIHAYDAATTRAVGGAGVLSGASGTRLATRAPGGGGTTTAYRVEGPGNARLNIGPEGNVAVKGDNTLFLNFGDEARAQSFASRRLSQGYDGTQIKSFDVPTSYVDELRASSVPENMARRFPDRPFSVDVNRAADQFGLRACHLPGLIAAIIPGSGSNGC